MKRTTTQIARMVLDRFGFVVIPLNPSSGYGKLEGQIVFQFGNHDINFPLQYDSMATPDEWEAQCAFMLAGALLRSQPPIPVGWEVWRALEAKPRCCKGAPNA
jgi:hypothetical protein